MDRLIRVHNQTALLTKIHIMVAKRARINTGPISFDPNEIEDPIDHDIATEVQHCCRGHLTHSSFGTQYQLLCNLWIQRLNPNILLPKYKILQE